MSSSIGSHSLHPFDNFGDLLKYLRRRARLTQLELSISVGYSEAQITRLEKNQRLPDLTALRALFIPALHLEEAPEWAARLLELAQSARQEDAPAPGVTPYKGLLFFDESDADLFFGREILTAHLAEHVIDLVMDASSRFLAVVGASGSGKSSLVRAGLAVTLKRAGWETRIFTPTANPLRILESNLSQVHTHNAERVLVLVDQFEEVFTLCRDEMERIAFIEKLLSSAQGHSKKVTVVIALRADFYSHCAQYPLLRQAVAAEQEYIGQMTADELRRAIEEPAKRGGWEFEPGLVDVLLQDVGVQGTSEPEPGALPLLSHALFSIWEHRRGRMFTLDGYHASGGVRGAIAETAESVFTDQLNQTQQAMARDVFLRLTELGEGTEDTRRRAALNELVRQSAEATQLRAVLNTLAEARLITLNADSAEVAHEALIREWQRLHEWLTQNRESLLLHRHLTESTSDWEARGHDLSDLYRGARLAQAREWASENDEKLNTEERAFLTASIHQEEHEALERETQRQRELASAMELAETQRRSASSLRMRNQLISIVGLVAIVLAVFAITFGFQSNRNAQTAQLAQATAQAANTQVIASFTRSESQRLAAEATNLLNGDPSKSELSALLSVRSMTMLYTSSGDAALSRASQMSPKPRQFIGHTDAPLGVAFSPDGRYLATAGVDTTIRLWDLTSGETIRIFSGHARDIGGLAFSPDGKYIATASVDRTARLWDVATGETVQTFIGHTERMEFGPAFSPDGKSLVTGSNDKTARLWDVATGKTIREFIGHSGSVYGVAFSPDGKYVATTSTDKTARLWDTATGETVQILEGHDDEVDFVQFSPDGSLIATSGEDHSIRLWETDSGHQVHLFAGHQDWVLALAFSPDGKYLLSGSHDRTVRLWDLKTGQTIRVFSHPLAVEAVAFSPNGVYIATGDNDKIIRVWNLQAGLWDMQLKSHTSAVWHASFSPDGDRILTASDDGTAKLWNATTGQVIQEFIGHTDAVKSAIFSPDGKTVLTTSWDQTARLWDPSTGKQLRLFAGHTGPILRAAFSPDGTYIVTTSYDGTARVWDTKTAQTILIYKNQGPGHVNRVAFSPDGKTLVTSGDDGTARIWDPRTGKDIMIFKGHTDFVAGVAFSPDGKFLLTSSFDGSSRLWDVATGKEVHRFLGHQGEVFGAGFSPDGTYIVTSGADGTTRIWEVATGAEVRRFTGHTNLVRDVTFSPDGRYILTASHDTTARLWFTDYRDTLIYVCNLLTRDFTEEERTQYGITDHERTCP